MYFNTDAIVIKTTRTNYTDVFLTLFTGQAGKIEVVANGAKSSKSQLSACSKPFVFGRFILNTKYKVMKVVSCDIHDSHFRIADNLESLAYGDYFLEVCNLTTYENIKDYDHYSLVIEIIHLLSHNTKNPSTLRAAYLIKLSKFTGHVPNLSNKCPICGLENQDYLFSICEGGFICKKCAACNSGYHKLNDTFLNLLNYLLIKDVRIIVATNIHPKYINRMIVIFEEYHKYHNQVNEIKSKSFLEDVLKF